MSIHIGIRSNTNPPINAAKLSPSSLADHYKTARPRDRARIQKEINRRDHAQQVHFIEKTSCLSYLSDKEQQMCHDLLPELYSLLFNTHYRDSKQLRKRLGDNQFDKQMTELVKQEIVDEERYNAIMDRAFR